MARPNAGDRIRVTALCGKGYNIRVGDEFVVGEDHAKVGADSDGYEFIVSDGYPLVDGKAGWILWEPVGAADTEPPAVDPLRLTVSRQRRELRRLNAKQRMVTLELTAAKASLTLALRAIADITERNRILELRLNDAR